MNETKFRSAMHRARYRAGLAAARDYPDDASRLRQLVELGGYTQRGAARELGISERTMRYYCAGDQPIPRVVMLAMEHLVNCPLANQ